MSRSRIFLIGLPAAVIALLAGIYVGTQRSGAPPRDLRATAAGAVTHLFAASLDDVDGRPQAFSRWQGKILVVNFWATWCSPCREEMPAFSRLQLRYSARDVQFVGIALDAADSVRTFSRTLPVSYPLLVGGPAGVDLARQLGNASLTLPYTLVIDQNQVTRLVRLGPLAEAELDQVLQETVGR